MCENQVGDAGIIHQVNLFYMCMQIRGVVKGEFFFSFFFFFFFVFFFFFPSSVFLVPSVDSIYICV